jgi:ElaB/YqjD/DUF883 family membrane-anchored ribosome-binding protein
MNTYTQEVRDDLGALAMGARALIHATANVAGATAAEARHQLHAGLERGREMCGRVRDRTVAGVRATDRAVQAHPYRALGIAVGAGMLLGYLVSRRGGCHRGPPVDATGTRQGDNGTSGQDSLPRAGRRQAG